MVNRQPALNGPQNINHHATLQPRLPLIPNHPQHMPEMMVPMLQFVPLINYQNSLMASMPGNVEGVQRCNVCGDLSSGYHYSVLSCEGCKVCKVFQTMHFDTTLNCIDLSYSKTDFLRRLISVDFICCAGRICYVTFRRMASACFDLCFAVDDPLFCSANLRSMRRRHVAQLIWLLSFYANLLFLGLLPKSS